MFHTDEIIDYQYIVRGVCSETGGMGSLLFVNLTSNPSGPVHVLKYCKQFGEEALKRFCREVRLMKQFQGNSRVMQILYSNLDHDPPYFVMKYFPDGDLTNIAYFIRSDIQFQEAAFNQMINCVAELHAQDVFHRDIKPQNFLLNEGSIVVSDLGLSAEFDSSTMFTRSSIYWGTPGYLPPEFFSAGGFKNADASGDAFMLGKTFYFLLCGRDPTYLLPDDIPGPLFAVIERCCALSKANRYQNLASLRQSLTAAYDVLLGRAVGSALAIRTLRSILDRLKGSNKYEPTEVKKFIEELLMLSEGDKIQTCFELPKELFPVLTQETIGSHLPQFLACYRLMAEEGSYGWGYAEAIADCMKIFFDSEYVSSANKAEVLRIAIIAAYRQNRFAAMDTCRTMITSVVENELGQRIHDVIMEFPYQFVVSIEESNCPSPAVRSALAKFHAED